MDPILLDFICFIITAGLILLLYIMHSIHVSSLETKVYGGKGKTVLEELRELRAELDRRQKENQASPLDEEELDRECICK